MQNTQAMHYILAYLSRKSICLLQLVCNRWYKSLVPQHLYTYDCIPISRPQELVRLNFTS